MTFTVEHKYCRMIKKISGENVWDAFRKNNLDINIWIVKSVDFD